jgi:hypothetical protein
LEKDCENGYGMDCRSDGSTLTDLQYVRRNVGTWTFTGLAIGAMIGVERWEKVVTPTRHITLAPAPHGGSTTPQYCESARILANCRGEVTYK